MFLLLFRANESLECLATCFHFPSNLPKAILSQSIEKTWFLPLPCLSSKTLKSLNIKYTSLNDHH